MHEFRLRDPNEYSLMICEVSWDNVQLGLFPQTDRPQTDRPETDRPETDHNDRCLPDAGINQSRLLVPASAAPTRTVAPC